MVNFLLKMIELFASCNVLVTFIVGTWCHCAACVIVWSNGRKVPCLFRSQKTKCEIFVNRLHGVLNVVKKIDRITQMDCKSRDESNEPN